MGWTLILTPSGDRLIGELLDPGGTVVKNLLANAGDTGDTSSFLALGTSLGVGNGNPFQYSCLEHPMGRRDSQGTVL